MESGTDKTIEFRIHQSRDKLNLSESLIKRGMYNDSITCSYLSIFYSARVLLIHSDRDSDSYDDIINIFENYYKPAGWLSTDILAVLKESKNYRDIAESGRGITVSKDDAEKFYNTAKNLLDDVIRNVPPGPH
jgi:uncharacterized protein (UPF0332 family)